MKWLKSCVRHGLNILSPRRRGPQLTTDSRHVPPALWGYFGTSVKVDARRSGGRLPQNPVGLLGYDTQTRPLAQESAGGRSARPAERERAEEVPASPPNPGDDSLTSLLPEMRRHRGSPRPQRALRPS